MRNPDVKCAAICGLFCGTCPSYPDECHGCLSDELRGDCVACSVGFRSCAKEHGVTRCNECAEFPCKRVEEFSKMHIVNGICHHENVIKDLREISEIGAEAWVAKQTKANTCEKCGELMWWHEKPHVCKK